MVVYEYKIDIQKNNLTIKTTKRREYKELYHNLQIICYIKEEKDADQTWIIIIGFYKLNSRNLIK